MNTRKTVITAIAVTVVFGWSAGMAAMGHAAALAPLAPVLGLTAQQVARALRTPAEPTPAPGRRVAPVPEAGDGAR
ncbi:hypothetical protein GTY83_01195 [Streptomyces sp. SID4928]|uniref:hypothetical protein n=1 Tax=Streptomyces TaxID=1883 RepID=UPI0001C192A9|nr:hypothetical protein [Streptomyces sp. ACT-1]EGE39643.1 hypothetical protein SACT1_0237 [Streptomyces sp. ACT-1]MYR47730.1 hypothetical protein [Streptomyces sp. SID4928]